MLSRMFPPAVLVRLQSILGIGALALLLSWGVTWSTTVSDSMAKRGASRDARHGVARRHAGELNDSWARPVYVLRRPQYWLETSTIRLKSQARLKARMLGQSDPFAVGVEPDFCQFDPQRPPRALSIKLTQHDHPTPRPNLTFLITSAPLNADLQAWGEHRPGSRAADAGAFGGALIINE